MGHARVGDGGSWNRQVFDLDTGMPVPGVIEVLAWPGHQGAVRRYVRGPDGQYMMTPERDALRVVIERGNYALVEMAPPADNRRQLDQLEARLAAAEALLAAAHGVRA